MDRRAFLASTGVVAVGVAGCGAPQSEGNPEADEQTPGGGGAIDDEVREEAANQTDADETDEASRESGNGTENGNETADGEAVEGTAAVSMVTEGREYYFDPVGLAVEPGTTVEFINESGAHSATAYHEDYDAAEETRIPDGAEPWDSGILEGEGATFEHTFQEEGTYDYYCTPHKTLRMIGRVVVGQPGGPAEQSRPPDGDLPEGQDVLEQGAVRYDDFQP